MTPQLISLTRRYVTANFLLAITALSCFGQSIYPGQHKDKVRVETTSSMRAHSFDLKDVKLLPGRVYDNLRRDSAWMASISVNRMLHNFRNNAGVYAGLEGGYESVKKFGGWESLDCDLRGHTTGHLMSAYGLMYAATGNQLFKLKGDSLVAGLAEVQKALGPSGYLSAFPEELINRNLQGKSVWAPWYTLHKILAGLIDQYLYCDNKQALYVASKMGEWAYNKLISQSESTRRLMLRNEFGGMNESLYNLYSVTGDNRLRELARFFYHNDVLDSIRNGDLNMGTKHTNTFIPKLIGEARNYELSADDDSRQMASDFLNCMIDKHTFATGSCSQKEHFFDTENFSKYINGYTGETCCTYNMLKLARHIFCWTASPKVADYYERALYNHILAQQDTLSGMVCYFLPLMTGAYKVYSTPEQSFWCCVGSGFESHSKYAESIYFHGDNELFVNLFIPSELSWEEKGLKLRQTTQFPSADNTAFEILSAPKNKFKLSFRYPSWSGQPTVRINGKKVSVKGNPSSYISINRTWHAGDRIDVTYPMTLRVETTPDSRSKGAILYGPIVLAANLGTEGITAPAPFSDPTVRNDYYTYNYNIPQHITDKLPFDIADIAENILPTDKALTFKTRDGLTFSPLYDLHHCRYGVYWDFNKAHSMTKLNPGEICEADVTGVISPETSKHPKAFMTLPGTENVSAVMFAFQNMNEETLFKMQPFRDKMSALGVALVWIAPGFGQEWDVRTGVQTAFDDMLVALAEKSGHTEIKDAPLIPFGHSAQATMPWNFAAWNPERTLCIISYHGDAPRTNLCGYGRSNVEWGRNRNIDGIPGLMIMGEYEWWDARLRPALAFRMMYPGSCISFLGDAGRGHFDLSERTADYIARFIEKSLDKRLIDGQLMPVDPTEGWMAQSWEPRQKNRAKAAPWKEFSGCRHDAFWYFDKEMADMTERRYAETLDKRPCYISFLNEQGKLLEYNPKGHCKIIAKIAPNSDDTFSLKCVFTDSTRTKTVNSRPNDIIQIKYVSGPAIVLDDGTFRIDRNHPTWDNPRRRGRITLCAEAPSDKRFKETVQEIEVLVE